MNDEQFKAIMDVLRQIEDNTRPPGKIRRVMEFIGLVVTIGGVFGLIQQLIKGW
jgi:hypothetical protein